MICNRLPCHRVWCLVLLAYLAVLPSWADSAESAASTVTVTLKIHDADSSFRLEATKEMKEDIAGLDALRQIVKVEYKEYRGLGAFVTSFCGVKPKKGRIWALYLDGKRSNKGISNVKLGKDTLVEWKTEKP